jgi:HEAT repeat protein
VPDGFSSKERALGLTTFGEAIQRSAVAAMETSSDGARAVLDALGEGPGTLEPFVGAHDDEEAAHAKAREIGRALEPNILGLARHPDPMVRMKAVVLLAASTSDAAASEVVRATSDASEAVQRVAFGAIGTQRTAEAVQAVTQALLHHENWAMRVLAARALGRLGVAGGGEEVARALRNSATTDDYALVREAALTSLASFDAVGSRELAERMAANDPEPRLRDAARGIAQGAKH